MRVKRSAPDRFRTEETPATPDRFVVLWLLTVLGPAALQLGLSVALAGFGVTGSAEGLFWFVVVAAGACLVTSGAVLVRARRRREAELGYIGLFFLAVSALPFVHGFTSPGMLYGPNSASLSAVQWSIPAALVVASPLLWPGRMRHRLASRIWGAWAILAIAALVALAGALLIETELLPVFDIRSTGGMAVGLVAFVGCAALSRRHLYLAQVANSPLPLVVSIGFGFVGGSALTWFGAEPFSIGFWVAHLLDVTGVLAGTVGALVALRSTARVSAALEPILATQPLAALELGLDPVVHRFVADLEAKDQLTRDHVIRTAELAVEIGTELGLDAEQLRHVGLTGLLHDLGKLDIPDSILNKPSKLSDDEFNVMKRHAAFGQAMVETSPALTEIGRFIRAHHERVDGNGYPDGRAGQAIPLISRIVAVCDSFDAMANTRQYRDGMGVERALAVLGEHAGSQWDPAVVTAAIHVIGRKSADTDWRRLDGVGRAEQVATDQAPTACDCIPAEVLTASHCRLRSRRRLTRTK